MSFFGPTFTLFHGWYFESQQSKLSWWLASATKYLAPGLGIEPNQFLGIPVIRPPDMADVFVPKL